MNYPLAAPPVASPCIRAAVTFLLTAFGRSRLTSRWITAGRIFDMVGMSDSYVVRDSGVSTTRTLWPSSSLIVSKEVLIFCTHVLSGSFTRLQEVTSRWPITWLVISIRRDPLSYPGDMPMTVLDWLSTIETELSEVLGKLIELDKAPRNTFWSWCSNFRFLATLVSWDGWFSGSTTLRGPHGRG